MLYRPPVFVSSATGQGNSIIMFYYINGEMMFIIFIDNAQLSFME